MFKSMTFKQFIIATSLIALSGQASAIMNIRPQPMKGHQHNRNAAKSFILTGAENSQVKLFAPDLDMSAIALNDAVISFKPTGKDNYHALVAQRQYTDAGGRINNESAMRYVYMHGKPTGHSPSDLTALEKTRLEIVPDPLPREHWRYKAGDTFHFIVRFDGKPLSNLRVSLSTSNGSILNSTTNLHGKISFKLPDDFPDTQPGRSQNESGELLLHAEWIEHNQIYASWLSADYHVDPSHWQDTNLGAWVATGGFMFGAFVTGLGFRNKTAKRKNK